jgi:hypothetical protein
MESQLSAKSRQQLDRFSRQYLQLQHKLDYPDEDTLRNDAFQQCLYARLFRENVILHAPPQRYRFRVLKELTKRIEQSIRDWEEEVGKIFSGRDDRVVQEFSIYVLTIF